MSDLSAVLWDTAGVWAAKSVMGRKASQKQLLTFAALDFAYENWGKSNLPKLMDEKLEDGSNITATGEANVNKIVYITLGEYFFGGRENWMNRALDIAVGIAAVGYFQPKIKGD